MVLRPPTLSISPYSMTRSTLFLHCGRRARDLVEQQGSAIRPFEATHVLALRTGECSCFVTEELSVEQRLGERGAVDLDEGSVPTG